MVQRQLTLDLGTPPPSTFDNFHTGANAELVARLRGLDAALMAGPIADRTFYVWGEPGNGRSHLLLALADEAPPGHVRYLGPKSGLAAFTFDPRVTIYAVDDCDALSGAQQIALFNLFNEVRAYPGCALVATGNAPPMGLAVREDLRTRLGWGLVFHLAPLSDEGKAAILKLAARERGIALADDVPAYLLTHFRRDMPSLMGLLDALDRFSLEQKRAVTLPLLRTMLANGVDALIGEVGAMSGDAGGEEARAQEPASPPLLYSTSHPASHPASQRAAQPAARPAPDETAEAAHEPQRSAESPAPADAGADADAEPLTGPVQGAQPAPPAYEAPRPPAQQAREPLPAPFAKPTDNVENELGAKYRPVIHKELGAELKGEVEADVSNEMSGELRGDLDPPATAESAADSAAESTAKPVADEPAAEPAQPAAQAPTATFAAASAHEPAPRSAQEAAQAHKSAQAQEPAQEPAQESAPERTQQAPPTTPAENPPADAGNGFTRFK